MKKEKTNELKNYAVNYIRRGWAVMPLKPMSGDPVQRNGNDVVIRDYREGLRWWGMQCSGSNIGLPVQSNKISILHFVRGDEVDGLSYIKNMFKFKVQSPAIIAPDNHIFVLYKRPDFNLHKPRQWLSHGVELILVGYVILPPSVVKKGEYKWASNPNKNLTELPDFVEKLLPNDKYELFLKWVKSNCLEDPDTHVMTTEIYQDYIGWADENGLQSYQILNQGAFGSEMGRRYTKERIYTDNGKRPNCYVGVGIK